MNGGYNKAAELLSDTNRFCGADIVRFGDNPYAGCTHACKHCYGGSR